MTQPGPTNPLARTFDALKVRDFLWFWLGMLGSFTALQMQMVARGYLAYELTGSGAALGMVALSWGLPQLVLSPIAGVVTDRVSRRDLLIWTQAFMAGGTFVNALLISTGLIELWHLVLLSFLVGAAFTFNIPPRQALAVTLAGPGRAANAIALNNTGMNLTRILGPALAGILIAVPSIGTAGTFYLMAASYLFTLGMLFGVPATPHTASGPSRRVHSDMLEAYRYIRERPSLRLLLLTAVAVILLAMPHHTLMPLFALRVYQVGPEGLGLLNAMSGAGALAGSLVVAYFSSSPGVPRAQIFAGLVFGLALLVFALSPWFSLALAALFLAGAAGNSYLSLNNTIMLTRAEPEMHGRLTAVYNMIWGSLPITTLPMSVAADVVGAPLTVAAAGALTAVAVVALNLRVLVRAPSPNGQGGL